MVMQQKKLFADNFLFHDAKSLTAFVVTPWGGNPQAGCPGGSKNCWHDVINFLCCRDYGCFDVILAHFGYDALRCIIVAPPTRMQVKNPELSLCIACQA